MPRAEQMVKRLVELSAAVVRTARDAIKATQAANDEPTADLLIQRMQAHEKNAWMSRSMIA